MGAFGGLILTNRGRMLQSKAQTGVKLEYTRIAIGDGQLGSTPILGLNNLRHEIMSLPITKLVVQSGGKAVVGTIWSNKDLEEGFYFREIGVFATDPDVGEILYCYANAGNLAEYVPPGGGSDLIERNLDIVTLVGNATNVTAIIDTSLVYATKPELDAVTEILTQEIDEIQNNLVATHQQIGIVNDKIDEHLADDTAHVRYGQANGENDKTITLSPAPTNLVEGFALSFKNITQNTGAVTINVNGLGAKPVVKSNGNTLVSGNLKAGSIYTVRYDGSNFILQGEGGSGNAVASDLLSGKTATTDAGDIVGTMPNRGTFNLELGASVPAGYYSGGTVPNGRKVVSGEVNNVSYGDTRTVTGLPFNPKYVHVWYNWQEYQGEGLSAISNVTGQIIRATNGINVTLIEGNSFTFYFYVNISGGRVNWIAIG